MYCQMDIVNNLLEKLKLNTNPKSWEKMYYYRIIKFFNEYLPSKKQDNRKLMAITENEIDDFIDNLPYKNNEKVNYYQALKTFFDFSAREGLTQSFFVKVKKVNKKNVIIKYITDDHYNKLKNYFISDDKIENRLLLALFLYTGLSRKYIANIRFENINDDYTFFIFDNTDIIIPIKEELSKLLQEYRMMKKKEPNEKIFNINDSTLSKEVKYKSKSACGCDYTPTEFSNTFIKKALGNEKKWENIYTVSKLTLESICTIEKHIYDLNTSLINNQLQILKQI